MSRPHFEVWPDVDKDEKETGEFVVVDVKKKGDQEADVFAGPFKTQQEGEEYIQKTYATFDLDDKIKESYLRWEKRIMTRLNAEQDRIRDYLANVVL